MKTLGDLLWGYFIIIDKVKKLIRPWGGFFGNRNPTYQNIKKSSPGAVSAVTIISRQMKILFVGYN